MFQEMQVTTGGADVTTGTPGAGMNFVLRSGTNRFRGSARYYFENDSMQSDNVSTAISGQVGSYNRTTKYFDTGFEVGGPILKDKLWAGARMAEPSRQSNLLVYRHRREGVPKQHRWLPVDAARNLHDVSGPAVCRQRARLHDPEKLVGQGQRGHQLGDARVVHVLPWRQAEVRPRRERDAPRRDDLESEGADLDVQRRSQPHPVEQSLFDGTGRHITGGFSLTPRGVSDVTAFQDDNGVWHGNYLSYSTDRPQQTAQLEGTSFKGMHELKFGFGWRKAN